MILKIGNKQYIGQCNALSYIYYKNIFKVSIFEDINQIRTILIDICKNNKIEGNTNYFLNTIIKIIYIFIYTNNKNISNFERWKKEIKKEIIPKETIDETINVLLISFTDEEVTKQLSKIQNSNNEQTIFPEHEFLSMCLKIDLSIQDLKELTYIDIMKIIISSVKYKNTKKNYKKATQADWDKLALM